MLTLPQLDPASLWFPEPERALAEPNGLLAVGGDLSTQRLLAGYRQGIFPWYQSGQPILWWCPNPRALLDPGALHLSRSLRKTLRQDRFVVTLDQAFAAVIRGCATPGPGRPESWITPAMESAYIALHELGHAHSVECWQDGRLVGGMYGVSVGRAFFGESMFSRVSDASKVALVYLSGQLLAWGYAFIDCQVANPHTLGLGAREVSRRAFLRALAEATSGTAATPAGRWELEWQWRSNL